MGKRKGKWKRWALLLLCVGVATAAGAWVGRATAPDLWHVDSFPVPVPYPDPFAVHDTVRVDKPCPPVRPCPDCPECPPEAEPAPGGASAGEPNGEARAAPPSSAPPEGSEKPGPPAEPSDSLETATNGDEAITQPPVQGDARSRKLAWPIWRPFPKWVPAKEEKR